MGMTLAVIAAGGGLALAGDGAETPEAVAAQLEGVAPDRWGSVLPVVHPDDRGAWAVRMLELAAMGIEAAEPSRAEKGSEELARIVESYGLDEAMAEMRRLGSESDMSAQALARHVSGKIAPEKIASLVSELGALVESLRPEGAELGFFVQAVSRGRAEVGGAEPQELPESAAPFHLEPLRRP